MKDPTHFQMVSLPAFDGWIMKCCNASIISSHNVEWTKDGLEIEKKNNPICLACKKENPEMIPYQK